MSDDFDEENEETETPNPLAQARDHAKRLEKDLKARDKELQDLRSKWEKVEQEQKAAAIGKALEGAGGKTNWAKFWPADLEPSAENVNKWMADEGLVPTTQEEKPADKPSAFVTPNVGGSPAPSPGKVSPTDYARLLVTNPDEARRIVEAGLLDTPAGDFFRRPGGR